MMSRTYPLKIRQKGMLSGKTRENVRFERTCVRACPSVPTGTHVASPEALFCYFLSYFFPRHFFFTRFFSFFASNFCSLPVLCVSSFVYPSPLLLCFISHSVFMKLFEFRVCVGAVVVAVAVAAALAFLPFQRPPTHTVVVYTVWLSHRIVQRLSQRDKTRIFLCEVGPPRQSHKTREKLGPRA